MLGFLDNALPGEYPGRAALPEPVLHARHEKTFAMLAMFALASCALLVVVQDPVIDVQLVLAQVARDLELWRRRWRAPRAGSPRIS